MSVVPSKADIRACIGKTRWASEKGAQRAIANIRKRSGGAMDSTVRPYKCPNSKRRAHWHAGHGL